MPDSASPSALDRRTVLDLAVTAFAHPGGERLALPAFTLREREIVILRGRSGSGKSTLLHLVAGLLALAPSDGRIALDGQALAGLSQTARDRLRPHRVGWVPQRVHLIGALSVLDNVLLPVALSASPDTPGPSPVAARERARFLLQDAGIDSLAHCEPGKLSVGQAARACIARALLCTPRLVCADEPSAALDLASTATIAAMFAHYCRVGGAALIASHDSAFVDALKLQAEFVTEISMDAP